MYYRGSWGWHRSGRERARALGFCSGSWETLLGSDCSVVEEVRDAPPARLHAAQYESPLRVELREQSYENHGEEHGGSVLVRLGEVALIPTGVDLDLSRGGPVWVVDPSVGDYPVFRGGVFEGKAEGCLIKVTTDEEGDGACKRAGNLIVEIHTRIVHGILTACLA